MIVESLKEAKTDVEVFQIVGSGAKRKLSRCGGITWGNDRSWANVHLGKEHVDVLPWSRNKKVKPRCVRDCCYDDDIDEFFPKVGIPFVYGCASFEHGIERKWFTVFWTS
ncbi:hypothetical protein Tco_0609071 [Tanacetum coccineum]